MKQVRGALEQWSNSKSKTFRAFCFCFLVGVAVASLVGDAWLPIFWYAALFIVAAGAIVFWRWGKARLVLGGIFFLILGLWRVSGFGFNCADPGQICYHTGNSAQLVGTIAAEPDRRLDRAEYVVIVNTLEARAPATPPDPPLERGGGIKGKVLIKTRLYPEYRYGDVLEFTCRLERPESKDDTAFRYDKYLALKGVSAICSFPKDIAVVGNTPPNQFLALMLRFKGRVASQLEQLFSEPEASFIAGLLYGSRGTLPPEIKENFNKTGLSHIIAISGYNITIIATILMTTLIFIGLWRQQAYWVVLVALTLFVIFTGASASVVRAAVMGMLVLTAQHIGRLSNMGNALLFAAAVMVVVNPLVLVWDVGFQLSFLATMGLVYLSPLLKLQGLQDRLQFIPETIQETLLATLSAIIMTLPLILYYFGRLSIVAPLVNILVLWIIPYLMLGGFLSLVAGFIFFPLGQIMAWVTTVGLKFVIIIAGWFGGQSWSAVEVGLPWWGMFAAYGAFGYFWWRVKLRPKHNLDYKP